MKRMMEALAAVSLVLVFSGTNSVAREHDEEGEHGHGRGHAAERDGGREHGEAEEKGRGGHEHEQGEDEDDRDDLADAAPVEAHRTAAQTKRRDEVVAREGQMMRGLGHAYGRKFSAEEREQMGEHWRHVMRLLRIRELAENAHDDATVAKVDALLDRADKKFAARQTMKHDGGSNVGQGESK